jgi:hypothetical protein
MEVVTKPNGSRVYKINGINIPSVTTILSILAKPALVPWAAKMTAESYTSIIKKAVETGDAFDFEAFEKAAKSAHRAKKKEAADIGNLVHEAIEGFLKNNCNIGSILSHKDQRVYNGFNAFLAWTKGYEVHVIDFEKVVHDSENLYAGRYDMLAIVDGIKTLIDFKTSNAIYDEYWLQLAAYAGCEEGVEQLAILRIDKETGELEYQKRDYNFQDTITFKLLAEFYNRKGGKNGNNND